MSTNFLRLLGACIVMGIVFALTAGAAEAPKVASFSTALNWITKSREYQAVCLQTYANAWEKVAAAARKQKGPWTIVMDLDETVLDNSGYQRRLRPAGKSTHRRLGRVGLRNAKPGSYREPRNSSPRCASCRTDGLYLLATVMPETPTTHAPT